MWVAARMVSATVLVLAVLLGKAAVGGGAGDEPGRWTGSDIAGLLAGSEHAGPRAGNDHSGPRAGSEHAAPLAGSGAAVVTWHPKPAVAGAVVELFVMGTAVSPAGGGLLAVRGRLAGEPLHFELGEDGVYRALGGIALGAGREQDLLLQLSYGDGRVEERTVVLELDGLPAEEPAARSVAGAAASGAGTARPPERLQVAQQFMERAEETAAARIRAEGALVAEATRRAHNSPRLWEGDFVRPRESRITSPFGRTRVYNDARRSVHMGVDFAGAVGTPVRATNRGVVMLIGDLFYAGTAIYLDHGAGLVTGYFHLSAIDVAVGDTVATGQVIGRVGVTGQVTGPHLHWMARYGRITFDPLTLLDVGRVPPRFD